MLNMAEEDVAGEDAVAVCFPWSDLPSHLQDRILSLLPISTLLLCKSVSSAFRSTIRSLPSAAPSPFFIFSSTSSSSSSSSDSLLFFAPSVDRWRRFLFSDCHSSIISLASSSSFLFSLKGERFSLSLRRIHSLRPPASDRRRQPYPLTLVESSAHYVRQIVIVSTTDRIETLVFDLRSGSWEPKRSFYGRFHLLGNAASVDDGSIFFVLSRGPDRLLTFDSADWSWRVLDVDVPPIRHSHLLAFSGRLFLVGGVEEEGVMVRIGVWELDAARTAWEPMCFMPEEVLERFVGGGRELRRFEACGRAGIACFYCGASGQVVLLDLPKRRWWWPSNCPVAQLRQRFLVLQALEPSVDILRR